VPLARVDKSDQLELSVDPVATVPLWRIYVANRRRVDLIVRAAAGILVSVVGRIFPQDGSVTATEVELAAPVAIPASGRLVITSLNPGAVTDLDVRVANPALATPYFLAYRISDNP
jgi:hypothetical protein